MRSIYTTLLLFAVIFAGFAQTNNAGFVIKGTVTGLESGTVYLMYKDDAGNIHEEHSTLSHNRFEFKGTVSTPRHCYISTSVQEEPGEFFVENASITVTFDKNSPHKLVVKGSPATDLYFAFQNREKDVLNAYASLENIYFKAIQEDNRGLMKYADSIKASVNIRHREYLKSFCAANPTSFVAEYLVFHALEFDHDYASIANIFAQLDPSLANTFDGKQIAGKLQVLKDVATDKPDSDFDSQNKGR